MNMLRELRIKNFAIIDDLSVDFEKGLNIITGETGTGKSILVDAMGLVLGDRAQVDQIKTGRDEAEIQAFFEIDRNPVLDNLDIDTSEGIIIRRIVSRSGKTRVYINDTLTNVKTLAELGLQLVDIHGQNEHQSLLSPEEQLKVVDSYGKHADILNKYKTLYADLREVNEKVKDLKEKAKDRAQRIDLLRFQIDEIRSAQVMEGEISTLGEERRILFHATKLRELCEGAYALLQENDQSVHGTLQEIVEQLRQVNEYDRTATETLDLLQSAIPLVSDAVVSLRTLKEQYEADPDRLDAVEKRLDILRTLQKKYGGTEEDIIQYLSESEEELETLIHADERTEELETKREALCRELGKVSEELTDKRKIAAGKTEKLVTERLKALAFRNARFAIQISELIDTQGKRNYGSNGSDKVEFLFTANPSEPPKPLKKVVSGGELSRVMLAVKTVFADVDNIPIMIFDEIDAGIGGQAAQSVGDQLLTLSRNHQVFCVTHLPQIASKANAHFCIEKKSGAKKVDVTVKLLEGDEQVREIARMLSGEVTPASLKHSKELLTR